MKYSVIDVSSSSLSLVVAAADEHKTEILFKERKAISLVHYLEGRKLTERGIEKLVDCLHELPQPAEGVKPFKIRPLRVAALEYGVFDLVLIDRIIVLLKILNNVLRDILRAAVRTESEFPRIIHFDGRAALGALCRDQSHVPALLCFLKIITHFGLFVKPAAKKSLRGERAGLYLTNRYLLMPSCTATATATVAPTMGLLPMPMSPIISTCAGTEEEPANCASECILPIVSVMP